MKVTFLGATGTVTGSNFLVEGAGKRFIVDCGLYQGSTKEELLNAKPFAYDPASLDFMLVTHAHIDHTGRIPKLYKEGFKGPAYATKATVDLCSIMLPDSGHIQETEVAYTNKKRLRAGNVELMEPIYTEEDAVKCIDIFEPVKYDEIIDITPEIQVRFNDAGHMLGSAMIEVWVTEDGKQQKIVFSGDIGNKDLPLLSYPTMIESTDYLVMESTYGDRNHIETQDKAERFLDIVSETVEKGGTVVIPSFAVGRTQEILYELDKIKDQHQDDEEFKKKYEVVMNIPVYVDSPLAVDATEVFRKNMDLFKEEVQEVINRGDDPLTFNNLHFTRTTEESKALNDSDESCVIISASGMCDVGRIKHHLKHHIWNPNDTILFVGYQAPGSLGHRIVSGEPTVKVLGEEFNVNARVEYIEGYSGHADQEGLIDFVGSFRTKMPDHVFLVHGEPGAQVELEQKLNDEFGSIDVIIPSYGEEYTLDENMAVEEKYEYPAQSQINNIDLVNKMRELEVEISDMKRALLENIRLSNTADDDMVKLNNRVNDLRKQIIDMMNKGENSNE